MPRLRTRWHVVGAFLVIALVVSVLWLERARVGERVGLAWLHDRGVRATGVVESIGARTVVVREVVIGDPARPDFKADRVELSLTWDGTTPRVLSATLVRPVLRLAIEGDGRVRLGALDRLRAPPDGSPSRLPDLALRFSDARLLVTTPYGALTGRANGSGNPARSFAGSLALGPARLALAGCVLPLTGGQLVLSARTRVGLVSGTLGLGPVACRSMAARAGTIRLDLTLPDPLTHAQGRILAELRGVAGMGGAAGRAAVAFDGDLAPHRIAGQLALDAAGSRYGDWSAVRAAYRGGLVFVPAKPMLTLNGSLRLKHASLASAALARLARATSGLAITPLGPLETSVRAALARAASDFDAAGEVRYGQSPSAAIFNNAIVRARSGALLTWRGGVDGDAVTIDGGGLPTLRVELHGPDHATIELAAYRAGTAGIAATTLRVAGRLTGARFILAGPLLANGPLGPGRVDALALPTARFAIALAPLAVTPVGCLPVRAGRVVEPRYTLIDAAFTLCPGPGPGPGPALGLAADGRLSGRFGAPAFAARATVAGTGLRVRTGRIVVVLGGTADAPVADITARPVRVVTAVAGIDRTINLSQLSATARSTPAGWTFEGMIADAAASALPFTLGPLSGPWTYSAAGALAFSPANVRVSDAPGPRPRVQPLDLNGLSLTYADGVARVQARLALAATGTPLARASGEYRTDTGVGTLDAHADLAFSPALQPYQLSERARGVIENVDGHVGARAQLRYANDRIAGRAAITLDRLSFATASLGPVTSVSGTIGLPDLPRLTSPPGQRFTIGSVNPGFAVTDGTASVQLLSATRLRIEELGFPIVGGRLSLSPVTIDTAIPERSFTLNATGLDFARFIERLKIRNMDATGTFDGTLPVVLTNAGGRIEHGLLIARAPGGRLRYVGPIGPNLPAGARLAFDALRSMRYTTLRVGVNGDLGGDLVSEITFTGVNEAPLTTGKALPKLGPGVPFRFGVTIRAPFRALLGTAAGLEDATSLIGTGQSPPPR